MSNTLWPFVNHEMDDLPNDTHGRACPQPGQAQLGASSLDHCMPCAQKNAVSFLQGDTPGSRRHYVPENASPEAMARLQPLSHTAYEPAENPAIADDETVARLVAWREEAPNG